LIISNETKKNLNEIIYRVTIDSEIKLSSKEQCFLREFSFDDAHIELLKINNGFYCYKMGLRFLGLTEELDWKFDLRAWNDKKLWKQSYLNEFPLNFYFADTIFGDQFSYNECSQVVKTIAETGFETVVADNFCDWIEKLVRNPNEMIDYDLLLDWYNLGGLSVEVGMQIKPLVPFSLGGSIESKSHAALRDARKHMLWNGFLATKLKNLKKGDKVDLAAINIPKNISFI